MEKNEVRTYSPRVESIVADEGDYLCDVPGDVAVYLGTASGGFVAGATLTGGIAPFDLTVDDFDGDGWKDVLAAYNGGFVSLFPGVGDGTFGPPTDYGLLGFPLAILRGDFNSDGRTDLVVASTTGVFVLTNQGRLRVDATISVTSPLGKGSGTVFWTTNLETDLVGFNLVLVDSSGRLQLNGVMIPCDECITGLGASYTFIVPKHKSGKNLYVEVVHRSGRVDLFGPVSRR